MVISFISKPKGDISFSKVKVQLSPLSPYLQTKRRYLLFKSKSTIISFISNSKVKVQLSPLSPNQKEISPIQKVKILNSPYLQFKK
jgi:hypothetical protein